TSEAAHVATGTAVERVVTGASGQHVVAILAPDRVIAVTAVEAIVSRSPEHVVGTGVASALVVARPALQAVESSAAGQHVCPRIPDEHVLEARAHHVLHGAH